MKSNFQKIKKKNLIQCDKWKSSVFTSGMELDTCHALFIKCIDSLVHTCWSRKKCWFLKMHCLCRTTMLCLQFSQPNTVTQSTYQEIKKIHRTGQE